MPTLPIFVRFSTLPPLLLALGRVLFEVENKRDSASVAGERLGVEASVGRVFIVLLAFTTERKIAHARVCPIIGQGVQDAISRSAVNASGKGIVAESCGGISDGVGGGRKGQSGCIARDGGVIS